MYPLKVSIKYSLVLFFAACGILFLSRGFGLPIPFLEYGAIETWNVFAGAALLALAACVTVFWHTRKPSAKKPVQRQIMADDWLLQGTTTIPHRPRGSAGR
jgi:membrane protease YdiL (CAAX protease family)